MKADGFSAIVAHLSNDLRVDVAPAADEDASGKPALALRPIENRDVAIDVREPAEDLVRARAILSDAAGFIQHAPVRVQAEIADYLGAEAVRLYEHPALRAALQDVPGFPEIWAQVQAYHSARAARQQLESNPAARPPVQGRHLVRRVERELENSSVYVEGRSDCRERMCMAFFCLMVPVVLIAVFGKDAAHESLSANIVRGSAGAMGVILACCMACICCWRREARPMEARAAREVAHDELARAESRASESVYTAVDARARQRAEAAKKEAERSRTLSTSTPEPSPRTPGT